MSRYSYPKSRFACRRAGFNLVELLIALIIISVLTVMLVPSVGRRAEQARITACQDELRRLADAEERAATDLNYYLRLFALDDSSVGDGIPPSANDVQDGIGDELVGGNIFTVNSAISLFIGLKHQEIVNLGSQANATYRRLFGLDTTAAAGETRAEKWLGPYITVTNDEKGASAYAGLDINAQPGHLPGIPNDPWGNDYLLFVRGDINSTSVNNANPGVVIEPAGRIDATYMGKDAMRFSRPTVLSLGPNGVPGDGTTGTEGELGKGDDLFVQFGG
jgi:prepilin-type N-terminal cleavage/methylation domain-containing protein